MCLPGSGLTNSIWEEHMPGKLAGDRQRSLRPRNPCGVGGAHRIPQGHQLNPHGSLAISPSRGVSERTESYLVSAELRCGVSCSMKHFLWVATDTFMQSILVIITPPLWAFCRWEPGVLGSSLTLGFVQVPFSQPISASKMKGLCEFDV